MTGEKNRGTTQEKLWNLDDKTLATPEHDALVLKLLNTDYTLILIKQYGGFGHDPNICITKIRSEVPITNDRDFIIGYWDVVVDVQLLMRPDKKIVSFFFEVKPKIDSFGATLRQLNTYKVYVDEYSRYYIKLFTPDLRFKDAFESQGIGVISPLKEEME